MLPHTHPLRKHIPLHTCPKLTSRLASSVFRSPWSLESSGGSLGPV